MPNRPRCKSCASSSLLFHTEFCGIVPDAAWYTDHLPLYRQEQIAARVGVDLPRQKLCRWVEHSALLLRTIHDRLRERILASGYVQVDETPVKVLDPDRGGHAAQAYLWTYL